MAEVEAMAARRDVLEPPLSLNLGRLGLSVRLSEAEAIAEEKKAEQMREAAAREAAARRAEAEAAAADEAEAVWAWAAELESDVEEIPGEIEAERGAAAREGQGTSKPEAA